MFNQIFSSVAEIGLWSGIERKDIHFIGIFSIFCFLGVFILQLVALVLARDNLERLFECSSVTFFCVMGILKLFSLHFKGQTWLTLIEKMKQLEAQKGRNISEFEYDSDDEGQPNLEYAKLKENYEENFKSMYKTLKRIYRLTLISFMASPFLEYGLRSLLGDRPPNYPHILPAWMPLDDVHVAWYIIMVLIEAVAAIYCNCVHVSFDITFIGIITFVCGQYNILFDQCTRIGGRGCNSEFSKRKDERAHSRIRYSHKIYISLVNAISTVDSLCKNIFGAYFFIATVTLCSIALRLKLESLSIVQMTRLSQYASGIMFQLYLCCTYGDEVFNASSINMGEGPFCAAIWCLSPKIRREIVLLSIGMSKLRRLRAGPFNTVNLPSFVQKTPYRYALSHDMAFYVIFGQFLLHYKRLKKKTKMAPKDYENNFVCSRFRGLDAFVFVLQIVRAAYSCYAVVGQK